MPWKDKNKRNEWYKARRRKFKEQGLCSKCGKNHPELNKVMCENCLNRFKEYGKKYHASSKYLEWKRNHRFDEKIKAMQIVAHSQNLRCVYCNCDDLRVLEINHKLGGGTQERKLSKDWKGQYLYHAIIYGKRKIDDLEIACRVCNAMHYCKLKYPEIDWNVKWVNNK